MGIFKLLVCYVFVMGNKYITIQIPENFVKELIDVLVVRPELGYSSRSEVVKDAVRALYGKYLGFMGGGTPGGTGGPKETSLRSRSQKDRKTLKVVLARLSKNEKIEYISQIPQEPLSKFEKGLIKGSFENREFGKPYVYLLENLGGINYCLKVEQKKTTGKPVAILLSILMEEKFIPQLEFKAIGLLTDFIQTIIANGWAPLMVSPKSEISDEEGNKAKNLEDRIQFWLEGMEQELNTFMNAVLK